MAQQLFRVSGGFSDGKVHYLSGTGAPGGDAGFQDAAPAGSFYSNDSNGDTYKKITAGASPSDWLRQANLNDISTLTNGQSWREPVAITDLSTDQATVLADMNADDTIQGVAVVAGQRFLLMGQTTPSDRNVFIVGGSSGSWTLTEDSNAETAGDTVKTLYGDQAGKEYTFDGTNWVWTGEDTDSEDIAIRAFIGKGSAGSEMPAYTSTNYVTDGTSLEAAIGDLDSALDALETKTDAAILATGLNPDGTLPAFTGTNFLDGQSSVYAAVSTLDTRLASFINSTEGAGITTATEVDSISTKEYMVGKWFVFVEEVATPANRFSMEVSAIHDGTDSVDATDTDTTTSAILQRGSDITGLDVYVDITGSGIGQTMRLMATATAAVNVKAVRLQV